jgi:hypothetical protein
MLGPFTDTWDDLVDDNVDPLSFGMVHYTITATSTFRECVKPRDVKMALVLLNYLFLGHYTVKKLLLVDSSMLLIKESSEGAGVHFNSIFVDVYSFDTFIEHLLLVAPMPFKNVPMSGEHISMLVHNKQILIKFCLGQGNSRAEKYFVNEKTRDVGRGCLDLDKHWSTSTKFYRQLNAGIVSSFESYKDSYIGDKKEQKLWIHHFVILQLFHSLFRFYPEDYSEIPFTDSNHNLFVVKISEEKVKTYIQHYGDLPKFLLVVEGCSGVAGIILRFLGCGRVFGCCRNNFT